MRLSLVPKEQDYFRLFSDLAATLDAAAQLLVRFMNDGDREDIHGLVAAGVSLLGALVF